MKVWKQHFTTTIASYFLLLSLIMVGLVGGVAFLKAREALKQAALDKLSVAATLKEGEITRWFEKQQQDFLLITQFPDVRKNLNDTLSENISQSDYQKAYITLSEYLLEISKVKPTLKEISILDRTNKIIVSTNKKLEGKYELLANITYVEQFQEGNNFAPIFYVSPETRNPTVTLAKTLRNNAEVRQGILLVTLNLTQIDDIVRERTGLGNSGETYLVGSLGRSKNTFISKEKVIKQESNKGIDSEGIDAAMSGLRGYGLYQNYAEVPVLGVYRWLNDQDLALIVEIHQQEAFAPARQLANTIMLIGSVSAGILLMAVYWLSRQLSISRKQLEVKAQEAETANSAKSQFLANMSHELRTPLNAILGFAQLMERDKMLNFQQRESLATINRSGEHLLRLINDVLEMSKIEAGRTILNYETFDLHHLLRTLQDMFKLRASVKNLSLQFYLDPNLPRYIFADEGKFRQILINLLGNAIKFTEKGGVSLRATVKQWNINNLDKNLCILCFEVEDTGKGISSDEIDKIFDPFVQTTSGAQTRGGTGLGLAISRQFVQLMEGNISVKSILHKGSNFSFEVTVALIEKSQPEYTTKKRVLKVAPSQPSYRILVVDDSVENRDLLAKLLLFVGFETRTAADGQEAIAIWQTWQPHLIWMDMRMPVMDGYEATRRIKAMARQHKTVIIALTASAFEEQQANIFAAGCDDLVPKPFPEQIIFDKMHQYLGVEYLYEEQAAKEATANHITTLTAQDLNIMPSEWVASLYQAATEVDADLVFQLIEQIPSTHQPLADKLRELMQQYDFDEIQRIAIIRNS
ncbi:MAG: response regulator [Desmonostoc vinosum HA7617-LM4]|jgi:signal transduction histidine kinase/CheY-like chemotaxis protein|nr:response regulator [Desmonostoc vinosum HA7617-LM4]